MKIVLIGFMGSGKSSVAKELREKLQYSLVEMDELVLKRAKVKNMDELFAKGGEALLRETEILIAQEYASRDNTIISTGAGVVMNKIIMDHLKSYDGTLLFLKAPFETIAARIARDASRPLFQNIEQAKALFQFREPLYEEYADYTFEVVGKTAEEIAQEIVKNGK